MFRIKVCQKFIEFCFTTCVYKENVVNLSGVKEAVIVNFWIDVGFFKMSHINGGI